jgi:hypothetical protein
METKRNPEHVNEKIVLMRSIYLRSVALIYLFAFVSLYFQIQGLWGDEGILPAKVLLERISEKMQENANFWNVPSLLWYSDIINEVLINFFPQMGVNSSSVENAMYVLCLIGIITALGIVLNMAVFYNTFGFIIIWLIYLNFFTVGQVFMSFQWDIFLLEVGFITILFSPITKSRLNVITPIDHVLYFLIRFLMFRFIYSNGIVKITADCPVWKTFNTLHHHFQGQPLPNMISWYFHFLPDGILKALTALTFFIEVKFSNF